MIIRASFITALLCICISGALGSSRRGLFAAPAMSKQYIVFARGNELWRVPRTGGEATSLHVWANENSLPKFSPDGRRVALLTRFNGAFELGTISIEGGEASRVTHYPRNGKGLMQWLPDGRLLYFTESDFRMVESQLYTVPATGGLPKKLPVPYGGDASLNGDWLAYTLHFRPNLYWKHYRGGMAQDIWLYNLRTGKSKQVTTWKGYDLRPIWVGQALYYVSDKGPEQAMNIWRYDPASGKHRQITHAKDDLQGPSACPATNEVVYQRTGDIWALDLSKGLERKIDIRIPAAAQAIARRKVDMSRWTVNRVISPDGSQLLLEARGDLWLCPVAGGSPENLTGTNGAFERDPAWSPDGKRIAFFSDRSGEYQLCLLDIAAKGLRTVTDFKAGFRQTPRWSPDSSKIAFTDDAGKFFVCSPASGRSEQFDADTYGQVDALNWSPDSRWIAYHKFGPNFQPAIWLYDTQSKRPYQATSGMASDGFPVFDPNGKYLYYFSNRDLSRRISQVIDRGSVYTTPTVIIAVPLLAGIGVQGFEARGVQLPLPSGRFDGNLAVVGRKLVYLRNDPMQPSAVQFFDLDSRTEKTILQNAEWFQAADDKVLVGFGGKRYVLPIVADQKPGQEVRDTGLEAEIDPVVEWKQIARDVWRLYRDYFYDPKMHGLDWEASWRRIQPMLGLCATRDDLNFALGEMISNLSVGHAMMTGPGDVDDNQWVGAGQLGADFEVANGAFRISRIYRGAPWDPFATGPLSQPGVDVKAGDYLLALEGKTLDTKVDPWAPFIGLAGKTVSITVGPRPRIDSSCRTVQVKLLERESDLRLRDWVERNRQYVAKASGGKLGYIYLGDAAASGNAEFARQFYGQTDKQGVVVDVRWNTGGTSSDRMIEMLNRPILNSIHERYTTLPFAVPGAGIRGPKCLLINRVTSSSGENFAYYFRKSGLGKLIGTRTWGGLIGMNGNQFLIDGGFWWIPQSAFFVDQAHWMPEGIGIEPDITVMDDPALMRDGKDPQLNAAIKQLMSELKGYPGRPSAPPKAVRSGSGG